MDRFVVGFKSCEKHRLQTVKIIFVSGEDKIHQICHVLPSVHHVRNV